MPPKPLDKRAPNGTRQDLWEHMMKLKTFQMKDLLPLTRIEKKTVGLFLRQLEAGGFVKIETEKLQGAQKLNTYTILKTQLLAPRLRLNGTEVMQGRGNQQMWNCIMKTLDFFTIKDLAIQASTDDVVIKFNSAKTYTHFLLKARYIAILKPSDDEKSTIYAKVPGKFTGPQAPQIQTTKQVFDPNLMCVVWPNEGDQNEQ